MGIYRGFLVFGTATLLLLGTFAVFVILGWPGAPNECSLSIPDTCFCEAFNMSDVHLGAPGIRQSVNTWSNLYAVFSAFVVSLFVLLDRRNGTKMKTRNLMRSTTFIPDLYIFATLFLGLGSMWFHGSITAWGGVVDGISMYVFTAFLVCYSITRVIGLNFMVWSGYFLAIGLFAYLHNVFSPLFNILILVIVYLVIEIFIWRRTGKVMQGKTGTTILWLSAVAAIIVASFFWWASQTGNFMCNPESLFQPHGLLWHPLAGIAALCMYFYWRAESD